MTNTNHHLQTIGLECIRSDRLLFSGLNLSLRPGNVLQIEGPNGSGKTSLLRILCGLTQPAQGEVHWDGRNVRQIWQEYMSEVTYLGHAPGIKLDLSPYENLRIARGLGVPKAGVSIDDALAKVNLLGFEDVPARALSAGQKRRVALARLIAMDNALWVLDEPFTALDVKGVKLVEQLLAEHLAQGGMAAMTTHHPVNLASGQVTILDLSVQ